MRVFMMSLLLAAGLAQAASPITVQTLKYQGEKQAPSDEITMPYVQAGSADVTARINDSLYIGQFGMMAPRQPGRSLSAADGIAVDGMPTQSFSVIRNDGRVFSIQFDQEGCGAYCENYSTYYSFDATTGRQLTMEDLFTPAGLRDLAKRMSKEQQMRYKNELISLRKELKAQQKSHAGSKDDLDDLQARIELNSQCAGENAEPSDTPPAKVDPLESISYYKYVVLDKALTLSAGRCSNHAMRALDDVGDVDLTIPFTTLYRGMTPYGKTLLLNEGSAKANGGIYGRLLRGYLGKSTAITMQLQHYSDNSVGGVYFYDKFRKPIRLSGLQTGQQLELTERVDDKDQTKATLHLTIDGERLRGRWEGDKQFDIQLAP
ncbi:hypothetical protein [Andreprevotia chitinilytica]|uniref:hypothetical protein n=1 Tax=Andreprevotia chitinilytica TaxID=396808 RepID=UPI000553A8AE|nr:hypothetical protein [Andreprevotia chitinilytica]